MKHFSYHSAIVRTHLHASGMHSASYTGFLSKGAWRSLGEQVAHDRMKKRVKVCAERVHTAVTDGSLDVNDFDFVSGTPPDGVWIVRPDQYEAAMRMARQLSDKGITRTVFLQEFEALALEFAERQCLVAP